MQDSLVAKRGINHGVVDGAVRPFDVEILLDEIDALAINGIHELLGFLLTFAASQEAAHFIFSGSVKEHTQRVWAGSQKMLRPPSDDDGVSRLSGVLNDAFCNFQNGFAVNQVEKLLPALAAVDSACMKAGRDAATLQRTVSLLVDLPGSESDPKAGGIANYRASRTPAWRPSRR